MILLGIDPGTATTGWGVVNLKRGKTNNRGVAGRLEFLDFGCILTSPEEEMPNRLYILKKELKKVLGKYKPEGMVVERLFFGANARTAMAVGQARGVVMLTAAESKTPFYEYTGLEVKLEVANHGRSDKKTVQEAVRRVLGVKDLPKPKDQKGVEVNRFRDDAYDAIAVALCHLSKQNLLD